jgi:transglutaminase-like putative cysteine protease
MLLELTHLNTFLYSEPVSESYLEFRLTPLTDASQHLLQHRQRVTPASPLHQYVDGLGNTVTYFNLLAPTDRIEVFFDSVVETFDTPYRAHGLFPGERDSPRARLLLHDYLRPTPLTEWSGEFREFVAPLEAWRELPVPEAVGRIRECLYSTFRYDGAVTTVSSSIRDILEHRAGVCQDFAHLMLATCRWLGFAARYVSGYVLPETEGEEAAASHAWCEVFDPDHGWFGVDPTHNQWVEERYVRLGVGRDYRDVPPNRGVFRGGGAEELKVSVFLKPITTEQLDQRARELYRHTRTAPPGTRTSRKAQPVSLVQQNLVVQQQQQQQQQ